MKLQGHTINPGKAEGEAIVFNGLFSFLGDLDMATGRIPVKGHELEGQSLVGKIFVFVSGKGSTAGPIIAYGAKKRGNIPAGMICVEAEPAIALGAIMADIPMVDRLDRNPLEVIKAGDYVKMDAAEGIVEVTPGGG
ncbi:MAG: aconitase X swivel domain-containing protein [Dehalococcoidia bacterium]